MKGNSAGGWGVRIAGTGMYLPGNPVTNWELKESQQLDFDPDALQRKVGIYQRHIAPPAQATSDLAAEAARRALVDAGLHAGQLDRIILGTSTADYTNTAASCLVQYKLGADCPVGDTTASCAGFIYALDQGIRLIATGLNRVCVIGADVKSRFLQRNDARFIPIFGDGAGAFILERCATNEGFMSIELFSDGSKMHTIYVPAGGSVLPASAETVKNNLHGTMMTVSGKEMVEISIDLMAATAKRTCENFGIEPGEVDVFIPHQANRIIMEGTANRLGIPLSRMAESISTCGNTLAATLPISYHLGIEKGMIKPGNLVLFVTAASGFLGGAAIYKVPR